MVQLQGFEQDAKDDIFPTLHQVDQVSRPLASILSDPLPGLSCDATKITAAFKSLGGSWSSVKAKRGTPSSTRDYSVSTGPLVVGGAELFLFKDGAQVSTVQTNDEGKVKIQLPSTKPTTGDYTLSMTPELLPVSTPLQDVFPFGVWQVKCNVRNKTDRWWRFAGRSFFSKLPRKFWSNPLTTIGLARPSGTQTFIDMVPIFGDVTLEYGISAMCNTTNPLPSTAECNAARKNTWWEFKIEANNGSVTKTVKGDLNVDYHLKVDFGMNDVTAQVVSAS